jgi:transposase
MTKEKLCAWKAVQYSRVNRLRPAQVVRKCKKKGWTIDIDYVTRVLAKFDEYGDPTFKVPRGGSKVLTRKDTDWVLGWFSRWPGAFFDEVKLEFEARFDKAISVKAISKVLKKAGWTFGVLSRRAAQRCGIGREVCRRAIATFDDISRVAVRVGSVAAICCSAR